MSQCPYCGVTVQTQAEEIAHMNASHSEVIDQRLRDAGFVYNPFTHQWYDTLADPTD